MSEQTWSLLVGFGVVVGLRLLDWLLPKGLVWREVLKWSTPIDEARRGTKDSMDEDDEGN